MYAYCYILLFHHVCAGLYELADGLYIACVVLAIEKLGDSHPHTIIYKENMEINRRELENS